jgi:hypothetical protein
MERTSFSWTRRRRNRLVRESAYFRDFSQHRGARGVAELRRNAAYVPGTRSGQRSNPKFARRLGRCDCRVERVERLIQFRARYDSIVISSWLYRSVGALHLIFYTACSKSNPLGRKMPDWLI